MAHIFNKCEPRTSSAKVKSDTSGMMDDTHGTVNDVLQYRLEPPSADLDLNRSEVGTLDDFLAYRA